MNASVKYSLNRASEQEIAKHLLHCDMYFLPPLSARVEIKDYAKKIQGNATRFEAWLDGRLVGLVAAYCNDQKNFITYITSVSVLRETTGKGIAACLMKRCIEHAKSLGMKQICLEVACDNAAAIGLYKKLNFILEKANEPLVSMNLYLKNGDEHE